MCLRISLVVYVSIVNIYKALIQLVYTHLESGYDGENCARKDVWKEIKILKITLGQGLFIEQHSYDRFTWVLWPGDLQEETNAQFRSSE